MDDYRLQYKVDFVVSVETSFYKIKELLDRARYIGVTRKLTRETYQCCCSRTRIVCMSLATLPQHIFFHVSHNASPRRNAGWRSDITAHFTVLLLHKVSPRDMSDYMHRIYLEYNDSSRLQPKQR